MPTFIPFAVLLLLLAALSLIFLPTLWHMIPSEFLQVIMAMIIACVVLVFLLSVGDLYAKFKRRRFRSFL